MYIGIDESGTFDLTGNGISLFAGVHLLSKKDRADLESRLNNWKEKNKKLKTGSKNEVKGKDLSEDLFDQFINEVIKPTQNIFITVCGTVPSEHKKADKCDQGEGDSRFAPARFD